MFRSKHLAEYAKQQYRHDLLELKAPQDGIVKDIATHTIGTVISPGTILMTLVPKDEILRAEVWVSNEDVGFIHQGQPTKVKLASYQFQKYGMVDGEVAHLSADATENKPRFGAFRRRLTCASKLNAKRGRSHNTQQRAGASAPPNAKSPNGQPYSYRALVDLKAQELIVDGIKHTLSPGMQVTADNTPESGVLRRRLTCASKLNAKRGRSHIHLGTRTILEYLLSPVMKAFQEAGRER